MKNLIGLIDVCCQARENPDFRPSEGITHCNEAVAFIAAKMGTNELAGRMANDIADYLTATPDKWTPVALEKVQNISNQGSLVIACQKADPHGHVVVCMPGISRTSGHWNCQAPCCINIGKEIFIGKGVNFAFEEIPQFFVWRPSL